MYRYAEYLHFPEIAVAALIDRARNPHPASRIRYGSDSHQEAYFLRPLSPGPDSVRAKTGESAYPRQDRPLIVFIHGGGWRRGHPRYFRFVGRYLARHGYPVLIPGYRLGPSAQFDEQLEDLRAGVRSFLHTPWARVHRPRRAIVIGQSAGGHLGAHLAYGNLLRDEEGREEPGGIAAPEAVGFISVSGVLSFEPAGWRYLEGLIKNTAASAELRLRADARQALEGARRFVPALIVHGMEDRIVPPEISSEFARRYRERFGTTPATVYYPWAKHNELALLFLERRPRATALLLQWLNVAERRSKKDAA
jgi:acetyl esterase/lipase